jgi:hypothetical protein
VFLDEAAVIAKLFAVTLEANVAPVEFKVKRLTPFVAKSNEPSALKIL